MDERAANGTGLSCAEERRKNNTEGTEFGTEGTEKRT
jgi:hypothetical protein